MKKFRVLDDFNVSLEKYVIYVPIASRCTYNLLAIQARFVSKLHMNCPTIIHSLL